MWHNLPNLIIDTTCNRCKLQPSKQRFLKPRGAQLAAGKKAELASWGTRMCLMCLMESGGQGSCHAQMWGNNPHQQPGIFHPTAADNSFILMKSPSLTLIFISQSACYQSVCVYHAAKPVFVLVSGSDSGGVLSLVMSALVKVRESYLSATHTHTQCCYHLLHLGPIKSCFLPYHPPYTPRHLTDCL